jgi:hypothetical protein
MQKIWKKHLETIIERINKMSVKELQERVWATLNEWF